MPTIVGDLHGLDSLRVGVLRVPARRDRDRSRCGAVSPTCSGARRSSSPGMTIFLVGSALCGHGADDDRSSCCSGRCRASAPAASSRSRRRSSPTSTRWSSGRRSRRSTRPCSGSPSVLGPFLGGFLTDQLSWRWVFYVNLPIGIAAIVLVAFVMIEPLQHRHKHQLDWPGIVTLLGWTLLARLRARDRRARVPVGLVPDRRVLRRERAALRRVRRHRAARRRAADPARPLQDPGAARVDRHHDVPRHVDVRRAVVPAALRAHGARRVGDRRGPDPHPDDAGDDGRLGGRRAPRAAGSGTA